MPLLLVILGATASGKSSLALRAALSFGGEIVNCDSVQVYRELEIGTARPSAEMQRQVPHHLYGVIAPDQYYSAGRYMAEARSICREIAGRGRIPIVVGGTGLYLRALLEGVFQGPGRSEPLRLRLHELAAEKGPHYLHRMLARKDAVAAARIQPRDRMRTVRALEVYFSTGIPISRLHSPQPEARFRQEPLTGFRILKVGLNLPRQILYDRIHRRVAEMFRAGLLEEVQRLLQKGYSPSAKAFSALGYRQVLAHLRGEITLERAVELTCRDTRRYAKRQLTWFRKEKGLFWIEKPGEDPLALEQLSDLIRSGKGYAHGV